MADDAERQPSLRSSSPTSSSWDAHRFCSSLEVHLTNLGRSLSCAVCHSADGDGDPVLLSECVHLYCRGCLLRCLRFKLECPACRHPTSRRSVVDAPPSWRQAARAYKQLLRDFGLAPASYAPNLHMTQIVGGAGGGEANAASSSLSTDTASGLRRKYQLATLFAQSRRSSGNAAAIEEQDAVVDVNRSAAARAKAMEEDEEELDDDMESDMPSPSPAPSHPAPPLPPTQEVAAEAQDQHAADAAWEDYLWHEEQQRQHVEEDEEQERPPPSPMDLSTAGPPPHPSPLPPATAPRGVLRQLHENLVVTDGSRLPPPSPSVVHPTKRGHAPSLAQDTQETESSEPEEESEGGDGIVPAHGTESATTSATAPTPSAPSGAPPHEAPALPFQERQTASQGGDSSTLANRESSAQATPTHPLLSVGVVVHVASRTWPGINKPGGVARIAQVHSLPHGTVSYDVKYVLGGSESRVDAVFVRPFRESEALASASTFTAGGGGKAEGSHQRKSVRFQQREPDLPPELLEQLAREGFDVTGHGGVGSGSGSATGNDVAAKADRRHGDAAGRQRAPCRKRRRLSEQLSRFVRHRVRWDGNKDRGLVGGPVPATTITSIDGADLDPAVKTADQTANLERPGEGGGDLDDDMGPPAAAAISGRAEELAELCHTADQRYHRRLAEAMSKGAVHVVTSALTEDDKKALDRLCRDSKKGLVHVKRVERCTTKNLSMCLVPTATSQGGGEPVAANRTLKTMQAALAGIPIVSTMWIHHCVSSKTVPLPQPDMFVRSLPCSSADGSHGVARLASLVQRDSSFRLLAGFSVHLCGCIPRPKEMDILLLLKQAGATVLTHVASVIAHLNKTPSGPLVLVCGSVVKLSASLEAKLRKTIQSSPKLSVRLVHTSWVFDSIATGRALQPQDHEPIEGGQQARQLWELACRSSR